MGTVARKLQAVLDSKAAIKAAIEGKGVADVGDVLSAYAGKIESIQTGGWTGHADEAGLKAIGWTDEDIAYYQKYGVNWDEEDDELHKVPQDNIDLYGVLTADNIALYQDRIVYLPKIDTSGLTTMNARFKGCFSMVALPKIDCSSVTNMVNMFLNCYSLVCVPLLDTSKVTTMKAMFSNCRSLKTIPAFDTSVVTTMSEMFNNCYSLSEIPVLDTSAVTDVASMFYNAYSLSIIRVLDFSSISAMNNSVFYGCYSLQFLRIKNWAKSIYLDYTSFLRKEDLLEIISYCKVGRNSYIYIMLNEYCYEKYAEDPYIISAIEKVESATGGHLSLRC